MTLALTYTFALLAAAFQAERRLDSASRKTFIADYFIVVDDFGA